MAWERGYRRVWCKSDSKEAIKLILSRMEESHLLQAVITDIKEKLRKDWQAFVTHVLREANACADVFREGRIFFHTGRDYASGAYCSFEAPS